jgi:Arc/MetJ family transcription regulator
MMALGAMMCTAANMSTQMRTNIEIDDRLMKDALKATGAKTKREAVELGLRTPMQLRAQ